jgi:hypothetical protein
MYLRTEVYLFECECVCGRICLNVISVGKCICFHVSVGKYICLNICFCGELFLFECMSVSGRVLVWMCISVRKCILMCICAEVSLLTLYTAVEFRLYLGGKLFLCGRQIVRSDQAFVRKNACSFSYVYYNRTGWASFIRLQRACLFCLFASFNDVLVSGCLC